MHEFVLAGDLGGTNLRVAAVDEQGTILFRVEGETPRQTDDSEIFDATVRLVNECLRNVGGNPVGFGFAVPAIMSGPEGKIFSSPNLPELNGSSIALNLRAELAMDVIVENDANAAAIGENWLGASRGSRDSICLTLGTGVGGGIIIDGSVHRGADGTAGEIGHICVEPQGPPCGCGSKGCLEQFASASAVARMASELRPEFPDTRISFDREVTALEVFEKGLEGDRLSKEVFRRAGFYLGIALAGLINVINPEVIVLGGGMAGAWDLFIVATREEIRKRAFHEPAERARIVRAKLGSDSGLIGAARLAFVKGNHTYNHSQ